MELLGCPDPSPPSPQIKSHMEKLLAKKKEMTEKWDKHWEWLQQSESPGGHRGSSGVGGASVGFWGMLSHGGTPGVGVGVGSWSHPQFMGVTSLWGIPGYGGVTKSWVVIRCWVDIGCWVDIEHWGDTRSWGGHWVVGVSLWESLSYGGHEVMRDMKLWGTPNYEEHKIMGATKL